MKKALAIAIVLLTAVSVSAETAVKVEGSRPRAVKAKKKTMSTVPIKLRTEEQKSLYGLGLVIARQMEVFNLSPRELQIVKQGINDGVKGRKPKVDFTVYSKKSVELGLARRDALGRQLAAKTPGYMELAAAEEGAKKSSTGGIYLSLKEGEGVSPLDTDKVKFHYRGTLIDGREFDSTYKRNEPDAGLVTESLPCLGEAVKLMKPGGKSRVVCPPETAFAKEGLGVIPPDATLIFEVELLEISKP